MKLTPATRAYVGVHTEMWLALRPHNLWFHSDLSDWNYWGVLLRNWIGEIVL